MLQLMKYCLFSMVRDKTTMFWSFLFPLILCTLFYVTFGNLDNNLECIDTAAVIVSDTEEAKSFYAFLEALQESEQDFISVEKMTEKEAKKQLESGEISGIYYADDEPGLTVAASGIEESILLEIMQSYESNYAVIQTVAKEKPEKMQKVLERISSDEAVGEYVKETSLGGKKSDGMIQYFFALISMTCLFGCFLGLEASVKLQANITAVAFRRAVSATGKFRMILADFIVICIMNFIDVIILLAYMSFILKIDLGTDIGRILLVSFMGCVIGVSSGILVGSMGKWSGNTKSAVLLTFSLGSSFLSGLMMGGIKGLIEDNCPIINRINPASLISDAFYCLSIYEDMERYARDIIVMAIWVAVCLAGSFLMVRRVRYDSI